MDVGGLLVEFGPLGLVMVGLVKFLEVVGFVVVGVFFLG